MGQTSRGTLLACAAGGIVAVYVPGVLQLAVYLGDARAALGLGMLPYLPGDALKVLVATYVVISVRRAGLFPRVFNPTSRGI